jgi:Tol biopolymer transport system component
MKQLIYVLSVLFCVSVGGYAQKKAFTIADLYKIHNVGAPVISPDGKYIAFTLTGYNLPKGKSMIDIYVMDTDGGNLKQITKNGKGNENPLWTSDSKGLYYVSAVSETPQLYLYSFSNKQSRKITNFSMGVNDPVLSPDNNLIAFSSEVYPECGADSKSNAKTDSLATNGPGLCGRSSVVPALDRLCCRKVFTHTHL